MQVQFQSHVSYLIVVFGIFTVSSVLPVIYAENDVDLVLLPETIKITGASESATYKAGQTLSISADVQNTGKENVMTVQFRFQVIDELGNSVPVIK